MPVDKNKTNLTFYTPNHEAGTALPLVNHSVSAGFPSPALDFMEYKIDLNQHLTRNALSTFYIKVAGSSMTDAGIDDGDLLVVDRSLEPADRRIAICLIDGEFTVKRLKLETDCLYLIPENPAYHPIKVTEENQFIIWAIVTYVVKKIV
ncbi:translesion error-prone DNA polymerase V autoproteolytic subunit [Flavobacterium sp. Sd200]|uniref:LexA family protein n=1 Tax=Flavobacterium sp. Sd200 TaxID=2692211 RepID=UPI00136C8CFE|nr:translesion error-prone DNA polymerase V autoproteolytic subunit [Flavobacterium sp. Sd200]MXN93048.1 translesion error-prone DNA polymerase V autoproteolytic subunit [Flavobacterium sp. Sd200]